MLHKHKQDIAPSADYWKGENTSISQFLKLFCFLTKTGFTISIFYSYFVKISVSFSKKYSSLKFSYVLQTGLNSLTNNRVSILIDETNVPY